MFRGWQRQPVARRQPPHGQRTCCVNALHPGVGILWGVPSVGGQGTVGVVGGVQDSGLLLFRLG